MVSRYKHICVNKTKYENSNETWIKMCAFIVKCLMSLRWRHNDHAGVSNHQPNGCLLNRLYRRRSKKTSKLRVTGLCAGNSPGPVNSPHKGPVTRKMFPFDDVIMVMRVPKTCGTCFKITICYEHTDPRFKDMTVLSLQWKFENLDRWFDYSNGALFCAVNVNIICRHISIVYISFAFNRAPDPIA